MPAIPPAVSPTPTLARGFTLTELAVVLVIVALLIGGMLLPLSAQQDIRARVETEKILSETREALLGFAAVNGRLPRPATSASNGTEKTATCANEQACSGFIPWVTLGTSRLDGYEKLIRYSVTPAFANGSITLSSAGTRTVLTRDSAGATLTLATQVPVVVFSHGKNNWGTSSAGATMADSSATNTDEDANETGSGAYTIYYSRTPTDSTTAGGGEFDDMTVWLSANTLFNRLIAAGKLP